MTKLGLVGVLALVAGCPAAGGGGETDTTDGIGQTESCAQYLTCLEAAESPNLDLEQQVYGEGGECWTDAQAALACAQICDGGLIAQQTVTPLVTECWIPAPPPTDLLFAEAGTLWELDPADGVCGFLNGEPLTFDGSNGAGFTVEAVVGPYSEITDCTLASDASFSCEDQPFIGTWTGAFRASWNKVDIHIDYDDGDNAFTCDLVATAL